MLARSAKTFPAVTPASAPWKSSRATTRPIGVQRAEISPGPLLRFALILQNTVFLWWAMLGSNQRPPPCKGGALPLS